MYITEHAKKRIRERCGLSKKALERNVKNALAKGLQHSECNGKLRKYLNCLYLSHKNGTNIRIYNNYVYIFCGQRLITVLALPNYCKRDLDKALKERRRCE